MAGAADRVLLVGCGKMGSALLAGWLGAGFTAGNIAVVEPDDGTRSRIAVTPTPQLLASPTELEPGFVPDAVVFAVKPQAMDAVAPEYRRFVDPKTAFLSIAAGKTIGYFEDKLGEAAAVVRAMPNTPAAIGRGISVACPNAHVSAGQRDLCERLLRAGGEVAWVEDEALLDPVTAVSGSGPAYVFLLCEAMAAAGVAAGLPDDLAMQLARATVAGAGELLHQSDEPAATLRRNVTSPGGTTAAALEVLMAEDGLEALMTRAIAAATRRSRELAS